MRSFFYLSTLRSNGTHVHVPTFALHPRLPIVCTCIVYCCTKMPLEYHDVKLKFLVAMCVCVCGKEGEPPIFAVITAVCH